MSTPQVCTFSSLDDCLSYSGSNCTSTDQLPSGLGTCGKNDAPRLFLSGEQVCRTNTICFALTDTASIGDKLTIGGQEYVISAGNTLTVCPDGVCAKALSAGTSSGKIRLSSSPETLSLTATSIPGISYVVVGPDAYVTTDNGATFYKSTSNPPSLDGVAIDNGKEVISGTATQTPATFNYVNRDADDFSRDPTVCNLAARFVQGSLVTYSGNSILMNRGSESMWLVASTDCAAAQANSNGSTRYVQPFRLFIDTNSNGVAYLEGGALSKRNGSGYAPVNDTAGCLDDGRTYFKTSDGYKVYKTNSCLLDGAPLTGTPVYDFTDGARTLYATEADISGQTCFQNGTGSYKFSGSVGSPTLSFFSTASCAPNTVNASDVLGDVGANCSALGAGDYALSADEIVKVVSSDFSCSTPACIDIGQCLTDSCLYREGQMAGKLDCSSVGGAVMGMTYKENPGSNPSPATGLSAGQIAAAVVTPIAIVVAAAATVAHFKAKNARMKLDQARQTNKEKGNEV